MNFTFLICLFCMLINLGAVLLGCMVREIFIFPVLFPYLWYANIIGFTICLICAIAALIRGY